MKKVFSLLMIALVFVGCSSDDDNGDNGVALQGDWKLTSFRSQQAYDLDNDGTISNDIMAETNCYQNEKITFNSNGTGADFSTSYADIDLVLEVGTTNNYIYEVTCVQENTTTAFNWTQNGNNVAITAGGVSFSGVQDGNKITFTVPEGFEVPVQNGDEIIWITETLTMIYTKQ